MVKLFSVIASTAFLLMIQSCSLPSVSFKAGGRKQNVEIPGKTVFIGFFESYAPLAGSQVSTSFTETLREITLNQSSFNQVGKKSDADWQIEGKIKVYRISPAVIQAGSDVPSQSRLTMAVEVSSVFNSTGKSNKQIEEAGKFEFDARTFEAFVDFGIKEDFGAIEDGLLKELNRQLAQIIYDAAFGGDW